jgi:hypothetical protein
MKYILPDYGRWTLYAVGMLASNNASQQFKDQEIECFGTGAMIAIYHAIGYSFEEIATLFIQTQMHRGIGPLSLGYDRSKNTFESVTEYMIEALRQKNENVNTLGELLEVSNYNVTILTSYINNEGEVGLESINSMTHSTMNIVDAIHLTMSTPLVSGSAMMEDKAYFSPLFIMSDLGSLSVGGMVKSNDIDVHLYNNMNRTYRRVEGIWNKSLDQIEWDADMYLQGISTVKRKKLFATEPLNADVNNDK